LTTLRETAERLGRLRGLELRLFEVMGSWVPSTPEPEAKAALAEQCYHHAWHAQIWADRFPQGYGHDLDEATAAGAARLGPWVDEVADVEDTVPRLAVLYRVVVPRLAVAYRSWADKANPVVDGPLVRWLQFASADETADWQHGEHLLQDLLVSPLAVERATAAQLRLEMSLVAHGGLFSGRRGAER
jgi:hypothetical protein